MGLKYAKPSNGDPSKQYAHLRPITIRARQATGSISSAECCEAKNHEGKGRQSLPLTCSVYAGTAGDVQSKKVMTFIMKKSGIVRYFVHREP